MREKLLMNRDWLFYFGDPSYVKVKRTTGDQTYRGSRAQNARGAARFDFDDSGWKTVQLPHDFVYENGQVLVQNINSISTIEKNGYPNDRGCGWYRRYFRLKEEDQGRRITILFDGVATHCRVYVNSILMKENYTAGIGFEVDITDIAKYGSDPNVISVYCDCHDYEAWYYEGGGIYRDVWLIKTDKLAVDLWGTFVHSKSLGEKKWEIIIETTVRNDYSAGRMASVRSEICRSGKKVAEIYTENIMVAGRETYTEIQKIVLDDPDLWSLEECNLYQLKTYIISEGQIVDIYDTSFGIREIVFDAGHGAIINGRPVKIIGFADHQWNLGVGNAMSDSMRERKICAAKEMGGNGYRTVHSPHSPSTYDLCDKYGLLVLDENRIFHSSEIVIDEVERMVKRDRNHPAVAIYSLYNEEELMTRDTGRNIFRHLKDIVRKLDPTRPVSGATSYGILSEGTYDDQDLIGINHETENIEILHKMYPDKPVFSTEMGGYTYLFGRNGAEDIINTRDAEYCVGGFIFTTWIHTSHPLPDGKRIDALGETGDGYYLHKIVLKKDEIIAKTWPEWDFPGENGEIKKVRVISNCDMVELILNGRSLGKRESTPYKLPVYEIAYEPGELKVKGFINEKQVVESVDNTSGEGVSIRLELKNKCLRDDNVDVAIITAYLLDKDGRIARRDTGKRVVFTSNEAGEYVGSCSTRPDYLEKNPDGILSFVEGKCQVFYRSMAVSSDLVVKAETEDGLMAQIVIPRLKTGGVPSIPAIKNPYIMNWKISGIIPGTMDEEKLMRERFVERWERIDLQGAPDVLNGCLPDRFYLGHQIYPTQFQLNFAYYAKTVIPDIYQEDDKGKELYLYFEGIDGICRIVVTNGREISEQRIAEISPWPGHYRPELYVNCDCFNPGDEVEIWGFFQDVKLGLSGITWPVHWMYK